MVKSLAWVDVFFDVDVAAAVILRDQGRHLVCARLMHLPLQAERVHFTLYRGGLHVLLRV